MTPAERQRQRSLMSLALRAALGPIIRVGARPRPSPAQWTALVQASYPAVYRARMDAWRLSERAYREERQRVTGQSGPIEFPRRNYPPEALDKALRQSVKPKLDALDEGDPVPTLVVEEIIDVAERHAKDAGRQAQIDAARHDRRALGYARRLVGAYNCAFCTMLASRGPVYRSADAALVRHEGRGRGAAATGEPFHDRCDCEVVPVFDRANWEGRDQFLELEKLWEQHANGNLQDWRRYLEQRRAQGAQEPAAEAA